jgi:hypothetical protein
LQFEELESSATEDEIAAEMAVAKTTTVAAGSNSEAVSRRHRRAVGLRTRPRDGVANNALETCDSANGLISMFPAGARHAISTAGFLIKAILVQYSS